MDECMSKLEVESFAFLIIPSIHMEIGFMRVGVGLKGNIQNDG